MGIVRMLDTKGKSQMRKGAFNRFSFVVAILSLASVLPVAYFHYKSTVPSSYVCDESSYDSDALTCRPYSPGDYSFSLDAYSFGHGSYIARPIGYTPELIISKEYLRKHYKYMLDTGSDTPVAPGLVGKEFDQLNIILKKTSDNLMAVEDEYKEDTLGFVTAICIVLPFLTLILLYILRFLVTFIVRGRSKEANT